MEDNKDWENIAKHLTGQDSDEEKDIFLNWINEGEENKRILSDVKMIWDAAELPEDDYQTDLAKGWEKFRSKIKLEEVIPEKEIKIVPFYSTTVFRIAASLIVAFGLGYFLLHKLTNSVEFQTAGKESKEVILPDGSKVWLNQNSKISYSKDFNIENRIVNLSGEAFFSVQKAEGKPFTIYNINSKTEVVGTEFNVRGYEDEPEVQVTVMEGKVSFSSKEDEGKVFLSPGDKGLIKRNNLVSKIKSENKNEVAWKTKQLNFENTHLSDVLKTLEEYFNTDIEVNNENILNCRFTGNFEDPDLKEIIEVLAVSVDLSYQVKDSGYSLEGPGCK